MKRGTVAHNPFADLPTGPRATSRDRVLSDEEITIFWKGCDKLGSVFGRVYQLLLATGCRRNEIGDMKWSEVDLKNRVFTLPSERSKNTERIAFI